jgi:putative transposase
MKEEYREVFSKRKLSVDYYIDGMELKAIAESTGTSKQEVLRLIHRCRSFDENGNQAGYSALVPRFQMANKLGKIEKLFLQYPSLENYITGNYFGDKKYTLEHRMNIRTLHSKFLEECLRLGVQDYEFPFNNKDKSYYTLRNYVKKLEANDHADTIKRISKDARQKFNSTGYGETTSFKSIFPYDVVQIDGHKIDLIYSIETENEQGEIVRMTATRMWVIAIIDVATRAILGYSITPHENYNQFDVLRAIRNSVVPHEKIHFTHEGFQYPDNGGFPSTCISETQWAIFDTIMLDNAKYHLAEKVVKKLSEDLKCTLNFGSVATPETRGIIERFFGSLETRGFHRLPGTTGSNTRDKKRNNPEKESVKYAIAYNDICELLEYLIAEYNNTPHSSLENQTPLQSMDRKIHNAGMQPCTVNERGR